MILALKAACLFIFIILTTPSTSVLCVQLLSWCTNHGAFSLYRRSTWILKFSRNPPKSQWYQKRGRVSRVVRCKRTWQMGAGCWWLLGCPEDDFTGCVCYWEPVIITWSKGFFFQDDCRALQQAIPPPAATALARMLLPLSQEFFRKVAGEGEVGRLVSRCFKHWRKVGDT